MPDRSRPRLPTTANSIGNQQSNVEKFTIVVKKKTRGRKKKYKRVIFETRLGTLNVESMTGKRQRTSRPDGKKNKYIVCARN